MDWDEHSSAYSVQIQQKKFIKLKNYRTYGNPPYRLVMVHGGPGITGELAAVCRRLSGYGGTIESLHRESSVKEQVLGLDHIISEQASTPVILAGHSWGAWQCLIYAAEYPEKVKKLILIGSGPFEQKYASRVNETRRSRLNTHERFRLDELSLQLTNSSKPRQKNEVFSEIGRLIKKTDNYKLLQTDNDMAIAHYDTFAAVWPEADQMRRDGSLLTEAEKVKCPVIAIQGDHDPHPTKGVEEPLSKILTDFRMIELHNCGHDPWLEKEARERFFEVMKELIDR